MNKSIIAALVLSSLALLSCGGAKDGSDLKELGLRGKVKRVEEKKFHALQDGQGQVVKGNFYRGEGEWDFSERFDKRGMYQSIAFLDRDGDTVATQVYEYNQEGNLAQKSFFEGGNTLKMATKYEYDLLGRVSVAQDMDEEGYLMHASNTEYNDENMIETCTTIDNKGNFFSQTVTQKNRKGFVTEFKYVNNERTLANWRKEVRDEEGKLTEMMVLAPDETLLFKVKCSYNLQGDVVSRIPSEEEYMSESFSYEYDKKSNWVKRIHFLGDSAVSVTEREIEYY